MHMSYHHNDLLQSPMIVRDTVCTLSSMTYQAIKNQTTQTEPNKQYSVGVPGTSDTINCSSISVSQILLMLCLNIDNLTKK